LSRHLTASRLSDAERLLIGRPAEHCANFTGAKGVLAPQICYAMVISDCGAHVRISEPSRGNMFDNSDRMTVLAESSD
jgi:hypothetical protein